MFDVDKILQSDYIVSSIPDEQVLGRKDKYIYDPHMLKELTVIDALLHDNFPTC